MIKQGSAPDRLSGVRARAVSVGGCESTAQLGGGATSGAALVLLGQPCTAAAALLLSGVSQVCPCHCHSVLPTPAAVQGPAPDPHRPSRGPFQPLQGTPVPCVSCGCPVSGVTRALAVPKGSSGSPAAPLVPAEPCRRCVSCSTKLLNWSSSCEPDPWTACRAKQLWRQEQEFPCP